MNWQVIIPVIVAIVAAIPGVLAFFSQRSQVAHAEMTSLIDNLQEELERAQKRIDSLVVRLDQTDEELCKTRKELVETQIELSKTRDELDRTTKQLIEARDVSAILSAHVDELITILRVAGMQLPGWAADKGDKK